MAEPEAVESLFARFQQTYSAFDYPGAYAILVEAIKAHPEHGYRYFVQMGSAQLVQTVARIGKVEELSNWLNELIETYPTINMLCGRDQLDAMLALRERNIEKGLTSPLLAAQGKTASASVSRIFNSGFSLPSVMFSLITVAAIPNWAKDYARGGASYTTHLSPFPETVKRLKDAGIKRIIVHTRDPRQSIVSLAHHLDRYPDQLVEVMRTLDKKGVDSSIAAKAEGMMTEYMSSIKWLQDWVARSNEIEIMFSTFEEFVTDWDAFVDRYLDFYGAPRELFNREAAGKEHAGVDYHFRSGKTDEWREALPAALGKLLTERLPEPLMARFGWTP